MTKQDLVFQKDDNKWYFLDETGEEIGPHETEAETRKALEVYIRYLEHGY